MEREKRKLSERLYEAVKPEWDKAATQNFVIEMVRGTLAPARFRSYMLQDYLYLIEYTEILELIKAQIEIQDDIPNGISEFVNRAISETKWEMQRIHIPNMKEIGITECEIKHATKIKEVADYLKYMKSQTTAGGPLVGLVALLQCSWGYAYIAQTVGRQYQKEINKSVYKSWFEAYSSDSYKRANQEWIDIVDRLAEGKESGTLVEIFTKCAAFETLLWEWSAPSAV